MVQCEKQINGCEENGQPSFLHVLCSGSDDRSSLNAKTGVNKYFTRPEPPNEDSIFRASCTCNFPTKDAYSEMEKNWKDLNRGAITANEMGKNLRHRLKKALDLPNDSEVILTPSGSDAEYIPLMFAKLLYPGRRVFNVVTCYGEVGSGTLDGAGGRYFSSILPVAYNADDVMPHDPLPGLGENVEAIGIKARDENCQVHSPDDEIREIHEKCESQNGVMILHSVLGSKTGICEPGRLGDDVITVVDACQGRMDLKLIQNCLKNNEFVLFTGSKFFRAPPFCGAVFVPAKFASLMEQKAKNDAFSLPQGICNFLTACDVPEKLAWTKFLNPEANIGLLLRWSAGVLEIEKTVETSYELRCDSEKKWRKLVLQEIANYPSMEILPDSFETDTIVSLKLRKDQGKWFSKAELTKIYEKMTKTLEEGEALSLVANENDLPNLKRRCFIGQPVVVGKNVAVLRLAVDSECLRQFRSDDTLVKQDFIILKKLNFLAQHFEMLI